MAPAAAAVAGDDLHLLIVNFLLPWGNFVAIFVRPPTPAEPSPAAATGTAAGAPESAAARAALAEAAEERASAARTRET